MDCELPVFVDIDAEVDQLFLFVQILDRCRREVDVAARAVNFPQVFETLAKRRLVVNLPGNEAEHEPDHALVERLCPGDLDLPDLVLVVFLDFECDVKTIDLFLPEGKRDAKRQGRVYQRKCAVHHLRPGFHDRIRNIGSHEPMVRVEHANACDVVRKLQIIVSVLARQYGQRADLLDELDLLICLAEKT